MVENSDMKKNENLEESKIEKFIKKFLADKNKVVVAIASAISIILAITFVSEMNLSTMFSIYMFTLCFAGIINVIYACNIIETNKYKNDWLLLSGGLTVIGSILRIVQMGISAAWSDLFKYMVIAVVMLMYVYKFLKNKGKEKVISILLALLSAYGIFCFAILELPFIKSVIWKIYNLVEATLWIGYIFILRANKNNFNQIPDDLKKYKKQIPKMKIVLIVIAIIAVIASGIGLLRNYDSSTNKVNNTISQKEYIPTEDLLVEAATLDSDNLYAIFVVKNCSDKVIKGYKLSYVGFDSNGNNVKLGYNEVYDLTSTSSANILPGEIFGIDYKTYVSGNISYVVATVAEITYMDGTVWKAEALEKWAENEINEFSIETYKQEIEDYFIESDNAENNDYLQIVTTEKNGSKLSIKTQNISDKDIKDFTLLMAQYDKNGYSINVSFDFVKQNISKEIFDSVNLIAGETNEFSHYLAFKSSCVDYKVIVKEIEFSDGTTWENPYAIYWILYNENERNV